MDEDEDFGYHELSNSFGLLAQIWLKKAVEAANNKEDGEIFESK